MPPEQILQALPEKVRQEQVRLVYKQLPIVLIGSYVAAIALVIFFWNLVPQQQLLVWMSLFTFVALGRGFLANYYWKNSSSLSPGILPWEGYFFLGAGLAGCLWGAAPLFFYLPDKPEYILLLVVLYAGLVSSCGASSGAYKPAFYYFAVPSTIPLAVRLLSDGREFFLLLGFLVLFFLGICGIFVRNYHNNTQLLIRSQFENQDLLIQLRDEKLLAENSQRSAEQAIVEKNRFLAAASHDLRQPLHALGLFIGALRREVPEQQIHLIDSIQGSVGALNHLFNSLLDVSRLDAGVIQASPKHCNLGVVIARLKSEYESLAERRGLELEAVCEDLVVYTDAVLLERVLRNLLVNAINYTDTGSVTLECIAVEDAIEISVIDTGIGIPTEETEAIFSEYYQLNNPERDRNKGLGLGLAIVSRLCNLMEIPITVESQLGKGTSFRLRVKNGERRLIDRERSQDNTANISDLSILVIDDDIAVLEGMNQIILSWGCEVLLAESASQAVDKIAAQDFVPDIIFSDYRLRGNKTGIEAVATVREELNRNLFAVIITGDTSPELLKEAVSGGFQLLHKPVTPDSINNILAEYTGHERL